MLQEAVILSAVRTPVGRYNGVLKDVRPDDLGALVIHEAIARANISAAEIEDVVLGCANQAGEDNRNVARMSLLLAGLPVTVAGQTVNRLCGSGLQAVNDTAQAIWSEQGELFVAGGVESMTRAPFVMGKAETAFPRGNLTMYDTTIGWRFTNPRLAELHHPYSMGETAENVASKYNIARAEQDEFALRSHQRAVAAINEGRFADELVNVQVPQKKGEPITVERDEHPRADTSLAALAKLKPAFKKDGTVTAGNSAGINDGAAALVLSSHDYARAHGLQPLARIVTTAVAGVDPAYMGLGPIAAARKALQRAGLSMAAIDLVELNEAFASQSIQCMRELEIPIDRLNVNGGAIALGHPLGASGARILTTLLHELHRREGRYGLACMCIGVGQGIATIIERL
ncbi:acetyl-CoA acetyltransferase [Dictyobacter kobayashii]|uniref:Acetyl-CoA acetyltransferase n=1 Tax=Dictyobacter kobayashii TaxID=2014872 RepID=A0A402AND2_9CHLR|nr:acetyl-CoA C-acyltransferase [Dictyobacter kobayashii]GCE20529.1 acetyl-CoA acetyltransferase [Dictyobacter kobayashii]